MFFGSYTEFFYVFGFTLIYNLIRFIFPAWLKFRKAILFGGSIAILSTIIDNHTLTVLIFLMLGTYTMGKIMTQELDARSTAKKILTSTLFLLIFLFCLRNYAWFSDLLERNGFHGTAESLSFVGRVGLSYILFRLLHFLVDCYRGKIYNDLNALTFLNYIFFFPTFLSGPIDRYNNFAYWERQRRDVLSFDLMLQGTARLFIGAVKKIMIVPLILPFVNDLSEWSMISPDWQWQILLTVLAYTFYIYFDFSGYSDIAIGSAYLIGIKTPENFNNPYLSQDISEFWKKWHISFSSILTEYVFKPCVIGLSNRYPNSPRIRISIIGYLYTFIICGLWHGSTLNFVYWGLWHGVGLAIYKLWDINKSDKFLRTKIVKAIRPFTSTAVTFVFVGLGWYFFMTPTQEIHDVFKNEAGVFNSEYSKPAGNFTISEGYWKKYGHGISIQLNFQDKKNEVLIEYRKLGDEEWIALENPIPSNKNSTQIHGEVKYGGDRRNLEPGLYVVRLRLATEEKWIGEIVQINNYRDE